jgi:hypothetical protein
MVIRGLGLPSFFSLVVCVSVSKYKEAKKKNTEEERPFKLRK